MQNSALLALLLGATSGLAHMTMSEPAALRSKDNPNAGDDVDYSLKNPITADEFPCKNTLDLIGTDAGASVADYKAGESYKATIEGTADHNGGSCQFSLSYDKGKTWKVIQSIIGDCPVSGGADFEFTIPADAPDSDEVVFSWSWLNKVGNREFYQNCAVVSISGGSGGSDSGNSTSDSESGKTRRKEDVAFDDLPDMFVANIVDDCKVEEGTDVAFPDPGPNVLENTKGSPPKGKGCSASDVSGGGDA